jgi:hypothetical protein
MSGDIPADPSKHLDLSKLPNNVKDSDISIKSEYDYPDSAARVFHPNIGGMTAYRDAIVEAYNNYKPRSVVFEAGTCHVGVTQTQGTIAGTHASYGWEGVIQDNRGQEVKRCKTGKEAHDSTDDFKIKCDTIKGTINVHVAPKDVLEFTLGDQKWKSDDQACQAEPWSATNPPVSLFDGSVQRGIWY